MSYIIVNILKSKCQEDMKIAVYHNLPSGGAKRALFEYVRLLSKDNKFDLYTLSTSSEKTCLPLKNYLNKLVIYQAKFNKGFFSYLKFLYINLPKIQRKIAYDINQSNYDLVWVNHDFFTKSPVLVNYIKNIPVIYYCHEPPREFYEPLKFHTSNIRNIIANLFRYPIKKIDFYSVRRINKIVTDSQFMKKKINKIYGVNPIVIKVGVDTTLFKNLKLKRHDFLLSVGALVKLKGFDFLIKALALIPKEYRLPLVIIGNGGRDIEYFVNLAKINKVKLSIKRNINDSELVKYYNRAFLMLYAPILEPLGLVSLEAMACCLPVLGINEGGIPEAISDQEFLTKRNYKEFSNKLTYFLKNRNIIEDKRVLVRNYIKQNWRWQIGAKQLQKIFNDMK